MRMDVVDGDETNCSAFSPQPNANGVSLMVSLLVVLLMCVKGVCMCVERVGSPSVKWDRLLHSIESWSIECR